MFTVNTVINIEKSKNFAFLFINSFKFIALACLCVCVCVDDCLFAYFIEFKMPSFTSACTARKKNEKERKEKKAREKNQRSNYYIVECVCAFVNACIHFYFSFFLLFLIFLFLFSI